MIAKGLDPPTCLRRRKVLGEMLGPGWLRQRTLEEDSRWMIGFEARDIQQALAAVKAGVETYVTMNGKRVGQVPWPAAKVQHAGGRSDPLERPPDPGLNSSAGLRERLGEGLVEF